MWKITQEALDEIFNYIFFLGQFDFLFENKRVNPRKPDKTLGFMQEYGYRKRDLLYFVSKLVCSDCFDCSDERFESKPPGQVYEFEKRIKSHKLYIKIKVPDGISPNSKSVVLIMSVHE